MKKAIKIPDEYRDKLDRYGYLLSRACSNINFYLMQHKDDLTCFNSSVFERLYSEAITAAVNYSEIFCLTKDNLWNESSLIRAKVVSNLKNDQTTYRSTNGYLVIEEVK